MKTRWYIPLLAACIVCGVIFGVLQGRELGRKEDIRQMAQTSAASACEEFAEYQTKGYRTKGYRSSYWYGVAEFRAFQTAYHTLTEGTNKATNFTFCNEVYGSLVLEPEKSRKHMEEIVAVMEILAADVEDDTGYARMGDLRHRLSK